jgi:hypothetical protein
MPFSRFPFRALAPALGALLLWPASLSAGGPPQTADPEGDLIDVAPNIIVIDHTTIAAWNRLLTADAEIAASIERGELAGIAEQSEIIKAAATVIGETVRVGDTSIRKRLDSGVRKIAGLADHLRDVAALGKLTRVETVYHNLHKYVEWVRDNLPPPATGESFDQPVTEQAAPPSSH